MKKTHLLAVIGYCLIGVAVAVLVYEFESKSASKQSRKEGCK